MALLGLLTIVGVVKFIQDGKVDSNMNSSKSEIQKLIELANRSSDLQAFLDAAATSPLTEITLRPLPPQNLKMKEDGVLSKEWTDWEKNNTKSFSIHDRSAVKEALAKVPVGTLTLADPNDNPLSYDRSFLTIRFADNRITEVHRGSL